MKKIIALRHMYSNSLFALESIFEKAGMQFEHVDVFTDRLDRIDAKEADLMVVLGGALGVYQRDDYPFIDKEISLIRERIEADKPLLGICLGAQLMAAALGEKVYKGPQGKEIGWFDLTLTAEGKNSAIAAFAETKVLQLHGDTFDLPKGAVRLASSALYENQAFAYGKNCIGVQFHPEFNQDGMENLLVESGGHLNVAKFRAQNPKYLPAMEKSTIAFMQNFLKQSGLIEK